MQVGNLDRLGANATLDADLVIIGGGPAGLTIAREFFGTSTRVLVLESGQLEEEPRFSALNAVESIGAPRGPAQVQKRIDFHGTGSKSWSHEVQQFGVRCRVFGGSSHAWAGKSAAFDASDFACRDWVPYSGWPFGWETLQPYLDRAAEVLNLGPNCYDEKLWRLLGIAAPQPELDRRLLQSFFWQFARSRIDSMDLMRFGPEFLRSDAPNVRVFLNATVVRINTNEAGSAFESLEVSTLDGARSRVRAKAAVLAASGIENPRLLLASNHTHSMGLGNQNDMVGRFLMDHPSARIGHFKPEDFRAVVQRFGFYVVTQHGSAHMYLHGLMPSKELRDRERLLNCAVWMIEERALDDPLDALKRLVRLKSGQPLPDVLAVASGIGLVTKGLGVRVLQSDTIPTRVKEFLINSTIRAFPNFVVREYQSRGLPHKVASFAIDGITEQRPDPHSRITLSDRCDSLGVPLARVDWRYDAEASRSLLRVGELLAGELSRIGLPVPVLEDWILQGRPRDSVIIDMGHTLGTTRMSSDPKLGVVDPNCKVHAVSGLYVAGASVFPTSGHANPTLMIVSLAIRLADQIKIDLARDRL